MTNLQLSYPDLPIDYFEYDEFRGSWNLDLVDSGKLKFMASVEGVYLLWKSDAKLHQFDLSYIGQSQNVCARIGEHLQIKRFEKVGIVPLSGRKKRERLETMLITALNPLLNLQCKPKRENFTRWLKRQHLKNNSLGYFAKDVRIDPEWRFETLLEGITYLQHVGAREECIEALWFAWFKFHKKPKPPRPIFWYLPECIQKGWP